MNRSSFITTIAAATVATQVPLPAKPQWQRTLVDDSQTGTITLPEWYLRDMSPEEMASMFRISCIREGLRAHREVCTFLGIELDAEIIELEKQYNVV